jgi:hypothetical protein
LCVEGRRAVGRLLVLPAIASGVVHSCVVATGVLLRLATTEEVQAITEARRRGRPDPFVDRSYTCVPELREPSAGEAYVVMQAFVALRSASKLERVVGKEYHGRFVALDRDATLELLALAEEPRHELTEILGDMRIAGHAISRWDLLSAPHRIELDPELDARLAPRRRG